MYLGTTGQTGRFLIFSQGARENPERAVPVEPHPCAKDRARMGHPTCIRTGMSGSAPLRARNPSLRQVHLVQQVLEARIGTQPVKSLVGTKPGEPVVMVPIGMLQF
jgi:hypothetical protein